MRKLRLQAGFVVAVALLVLLQYRLWFQNDGIYEVLSLKKSLATQSMETEKLKKRNEELAFQVTRMQKSKDATEARARNELGMIKNGETFYQFVK